MHAIVSYDICWNTLFFQDLSHDPKVVEDNKNDPLCKPYGTLRGLDDMIRGVIVSFSFFHLNSCSD